MVSRHCSLVALGILFLAAILRTPARAGDPPASAAPCDAGGFVDETATNGRFTDFTVFLTDEFGNNIPGSQMTGSTSRSGAGGLPTTRRFPVPRGPAAGGQHICDVRNIARIRSRELLEEMAGTSQLDIESAFFNTTTGLYEMEGVFAMTDFAIGNGVPLKIPDLFADTNGTSTLDDGDYLYSLVNLRQYVVSPPSFGDTQSFSIVGGLVASLPGMKFSTTPFSFSPSGGFSNGTPFTGDAVVGSFHTIQTPEPTAAALLILGATCAFGHRCRSRQEQHRSR